MGTGGLTTIISLLRWILRAGKAGAAYRPDHYSLPSARLNAENRALDHNLCASYLVRIEGSALRRALSPGRSPGAPLSPISLEEHRSFGHELTGYRAPA